MEIVLGVHHILLLNNDHPAIIQSHLKFKVALETYCFKKMIIMSSANDGHLFGPIVLPT